MIKFFNDFCKLNDEEFNKTCGHLNNIYKKH